MSPPIAKAIFKIEAINKSKLLKSISILIAVCLLIFLFFYVQTVISAISYSSREARVLIYSKLSFASNLISKVRGIKALTEENIRLREENHGLIVKLANHEKLLEENEFLRESVGLRVMQNSKSLIAGVFNLESTPRGNSLLINRGQEEGVKKDDIVISSSGILIGIVDSASNYYSRVTMVTNLNFKTTIKILSKNISGIATGAINNGVYLNFISENDDLNEGDIVVTSGNDIFPPGLIVGKVARISSNSGSLFKNVSVSPAIREIDLSQVLILLR